MKMKNIFAFFSLAVLLSVSPASTRDVLRFVEYDRTNFATYSVDSYNCLNFAEDLTSNARAAGFDASVWVVVFAGPPERAHAIVRFRTIDGPMWIESIDDTRLAAPVVGQLLCGTDDGLCYDVGVIEVVGPYNP